MNKLMFLILFLSFSSCRPHFVYTDAPESKKKTTSINLESYIPKGSQKRIPKVSENASGLTFSRHTKTFFVIVDSGKIVEFTRDDKSKRTIRLSGFADPEGITHIEGDMFAIVEENRGTISFVTLDAKTEMAKRDPSTGIKVDSVGGNRGLEGLTYDSVSETFFLVKERDPMKIYRVTRGGEVSTPWNAESNSFGLKDLSGVFFDSGSQHLILLSHESKVALECTATGREVSRLPLDLSKAEGVTMDEEGNLYICGEPNTLQVFEKEN